MGPDHVGLLVYGVFNASVPTSKIPPAFRADAGEANRLVHAHTGQVIEAGATVIFTVTSYVSAHAALSRAPHTRSCGAPAGWRRSTPF
jgi:hypothetical protein